MTYRVANQDRLGSAALAAGGHRDEEGACLDGTCLKALIFDLDGTLYRQGALRRAMLCRLLWAHLIHPLRGLLTFRALRAYRKAQEVLRERPSNTGDVARAQLELACKLAGVGPETVGPSVARWMEQEPLALLPGLLREGASELLREAKRRGLRLGVFSDYPADRKLVAMGLAAFFDVVVTAQDSEVQRFKPHPRGLEVTLERLGVERQDALYIGDRPEVDRVTACRAGVKCVILGGRTSLNPRLLELGSPGDTDTSRLRE